VLNCIKDLPDNSINCCVTSPPYFGLRDYGHPDQIGLEQTPEQYVAGMVQVFEQVKRVLKPEGTLWLNLGDSYAGSWGNAGGHNRGNGEQREIKSGSKIKDQKERNGSFVPPGANGFDGIKKKDLIGIPWMVAFALRSAGWYLRQDIIWHKPNPMPESVTDRCTKAHEYIFLLSKSPKYFYDHDAIKTEAAPASYERLNQDIQNQAGSDRVPGKTNGAMKAVRSKSQSFKREDSKRGIPIPGQTKGTHREDRAESGYDVMKANKRSVWTVTTKPFKEAHFATFPPDLITPCILAGCPEGGIVLDPFMGAGTTALVALRNNRCFTGFELNADYIDIAERRLLKEFPEYKDILL